MSKEFDKFVDELYKTYLRRAKLKLLPADISRRGKKIVGCDRAAIGDKKFVDVLKEIEDSQDIKIYMNELWG